MTSNSAPQHPGETEIEPKFPIVGVAASAGGLEAFTQLLEHLPVDTGMSFVLIWHLSPDRESLQTAKFDSMPNAAVATGNVDFVLPPEQIAAELVALSRNLMWTQYGSVNQRLKSPLVMQSPPTRTKNRSKVSLTEPYQMWTNPQPLISSD